MKRIVSILLALFALSLVSAALAEPITVAPGDEVTLTVSLSEGGGLSAVIGIDANDAPVSFVSAAASGPNDAVPPKEIKDYFVVVNLDGLDINSSGTAISGDSGNYSVVSLEKGTVGTVTFKVTDEAVEGTTYEVKTRKISGSAVVEGSVSFIVETSSSGGGDTGEGGDSGEGGDTGEGGRIPGDANEDGLVNARDAMAILKYAAGGWNVIINLSNADVNGDEAVNARDAMAILKYAAGGWDVVLK